MSKTPSEVIFTAAGGVLRPKGYPVNHPAHYTIGGVWCEVHEGEPREGQPCPCCAAVRIAAMRDALALIYGKWENGETCYEFPDTSRERRIGNAFDLTHEEKAAIRELLK